MTWGEVYLTIQGIIQSSEPLRWAAFLVHRSLVNKPVDIQQERPMPFDEKQEGGSNFERLKQKLLDYKLKHGRAAA